MTKNAIHNFNLSIKNSADIKSSEHLTEAILKELAKVSKEMSQQKDIVQVWQEHQTLNTADIVNNSRTSIGEGATNTTAKKSEKQIAVSITSSVTEGTIANLTVSTEGGTNGVPELLGTTSSVSETRTSTLNASIGGGVADTSGGMTMSSPTSANTTSPISGAEDNASNLSSGITTQTYENVAAQQTLTVPSMLQANSGEPTIDVVRAEIKKKLEIARITNDTDAITYWTGISKAFDEGATVQDFDGQPNNMLFTEMYTMLKQSNTVIESQNFNWEIVREKMIRSIDANILNGKISKGSKSRWEIIKKQLNDDSINVANLFEHYDELFLLLKEVEGLDSLPNTITITTKTKIYPNLSADNLYANIGKEAVYVFLKEINNQEVQGSAVNKGAVKIKNTEATSFIVGESLEFFLDENFIKQNIFQKQNINWVVYNSKKKNDKGTIFINEGTSFSYNFDAAGTYKVEAYGNKPGANTKKNVGLSAFVELKIIVQEIVITSSGISKDGLTRASTKEQLFKVALKNPEIKTLNPLKLYYLVESKTANKITVISEEQELDSTGIVKFSMPNLGQYCIKISSKDQYNLIQKHSINAIKNFVNGIDKVKDNAENDLYLYSKTNRNAIFKTKTFKIEPATSQEKENVKWLVYDKKGNLYVPDGLKLQIENSDAEKPYLFKGESFIFPVPKKEGEFTVEAYSNIKQGLKSKSVRKIDVKHPQVTEAFWTYNDGGKKKTSGFAGEINHIKASIPGYINQVVRIKFFLNESKVANYYNDTKTNANGEIDKKIKFDANLQKHFGIKNGKTAKIRFELEGIQNGNEPYLFKQNTNVYNEAVLNVTTGAKITDAYFIYDGNRVTPFTQVPYGAKVTGVVKTLNMVGKKVKLKIYKDVHHAKHTAKAIVDNEGVATINFALDKKWKEITPLLGLTDMFYIGMEGIESKISLQNGMNAVVGNGVKPIKEKKEIIDENNPQLIWGAKVSKEFRIRVVQICKNIEKQKDIPFSPNVLMNIMAFETINSFSPTAGTFKDDPDDNRKGGYVGLIQFGKDASDHLKVKRSELLNMTALKQLDYVEKWFLLKTKDQLKTATDIYLSVNYPTASGKGHIDKEVVYGDPKAAYRANKPFLREADEIDKKGKKVGKKDGKTFVWEVREALEETAKEGEYARNIWRNPLDRMELRGWYSTWRIDASKYGIVPSRSAGFHDGLDLYASIGTDVYACVDGIRVNVGPNPSTTYGNTITLKGYYNGKLYYFFYAHLSKVFLKMGEKVKAGKVIGLTGNTGDGASKLLPKQRHLHFEVRTSSAARHASTSPVEAISELENNINMNPSPESQI